MQGLFTALSQITSISLEVVILIILVRRRLETRLLWFLVYIIYELFESVARFAVTGNKDLYWNVYWWTEIGDVSLTVLAFRESFLNTFREYTRLREFVMVVWSCIGAALLYGLFKALVFPPVQANRRGAIIIGLEVAINFALSIVGILYFALRALFKTEGHQWESGIVAGFGVYIVLAIFGFLIRSVFGTKFRLLNAWIFPVGYLLAEAIWVVELSRPERKRLKPTRDLTIDDLTKMEQYSRVLERFLGRKA